MPVSKTVLEGSSPSTPANCKTLALQVFFYLYYDCPWSVIAMEQKRSRNEKHPIFNIDMLLAAIAVLIITIVGTVLLVADRAEQNVILTPEAEYIENPQSEALYENTVININTASKEELMFLNGIGSARADAIIQYREEKPFSKKEDIMNISGIGQKLFDSISDKICVE